MHVHKRVQNSMNLRPLLDLEDTLEQATTQSQNKSTPLSEKFDFSDRNSPGSGWSELKQSIIQNGLGIGIHVNQPVCLSEHKRMLGQQQR